MNAQKPLLEILCNPELGRPSSIRVYPNGLYHFRMDDQPWQEVWTFTQEEMAELRAAIAESGFFELPETIPPERSDRVDTFSIWTINREGETHSVRLEAGAQEQVLENLFHAFTKLRKQTPERSEWMVRLADGSLREFTVLGSINDFPLLHSLIEALFLPGSITKDVRAGESQPLVKTRWFTATGIQETIYFDNGLYTRCCDGGKEEAIFHSPEQVRQLKEAISLIEWSEIPEHIDTTHW